MSSPARSPGGRDLLPSQRQLFDIPREIAYLNCGYMSPLLRSAREAGEQAMGRKARPWTLTAPDFFREPEAIRERVGRLMGAPPDDIALVPSVSYGMAVAAANLPLDSGQRVLLLDEGFPSVIHAWRDRARTAGAEAVLIPRPADDDWTGALLDAVDTRTAVAAVPTCHWTDGALLDLAQIARRLQEVGAALAVDATQSLGVMPFDLAEVDPDFVAVAGYKWLLGPYSVSYLYVAPRWQGGRPIEFNWIAREGSEDFAGLTRYREGFRGGARRYDVGEVSNFALLPAAIAGLDQILAWGVERVYPAVSALADLVVESAAELGLTAVPMDRRAGHYVGLRSRVPLPGDLGSRLARAGVFVSTRGSALRVTPHLYNDPEDLDRLRRALGSALA